MRVKNEYSNIIELKYQLLCTGGGVSGIRYHAKDYYWDKGAMKGFNSKILKIYASGLIITSEYMDDPSTKAYSIVFFNHSTGLTIRLLHACNKKDAYDYVEALDKALFQEYTDNKKSKELV